MKFNEFYHMIPIIDGIIYDKEDSCLNLYVITICKPKNKEVLK